MTVNDMNLIRSQNHVLYVYNVRKIGLCNLDDKRFLEKCDSWTFVWTL